MIRFSKALLVNPAKIWISGIRCNFNNIAKIVNVFNCKWTVVTIDSVTVESPLLTLMKNQGLKYIARQSAGNCVEISVVIPCTLCEDFLEKAINEDPENIFVLNFLDSEKWDIHLHRSFEELIAAGIVNMAISVSLDENAMLVSINKFLLTPREVFKKIKALRFD